MGPFDASAAPTPGLDQVSANDWTNWQGSYVDTTYNAPMTPDTVTTDISTQQQTVSSQPVNDQWTSFFKGIVGSAVDYSIKKDAIKNGVPLNQPGYTSAMPQQQRQNNGMVLLIGAAVVAFMVLEK